MAERIITADEARRLREAATPGPWRVSRADSVVPHVSGPEWPVAHVPGDDDARPWDWDGHAPIEPTPLADAALLAAAPDLAASVEHHAARADRLARILAVERGDASQAPEGWEPRGADEWTRIVAGRVVCIHRYAPNGVSVWEIVRGGRRDDPGHREWPTALEAMEAIDAEVTRG